ncbi:MAG: hypothetical protein V4494_03400 [Chlamydiota bacterium]
MSTIGKIILNPDKGQTPSSHDESPPLKASSSRVQDAFGQFIAKGKEKFYLHAKADNNRSYIQENPYIPGTLSILTFPLDLAALIKDFICAKINNDTSAQLDISVRIAMLPLGVGYRFASCLVSLVEFLSLLHPFERGLRTFGPTILTIAKIVNIAALALWSLELIFESVGLYKNVSFYNELSSVNPYGDRRDKSIAFLKKNFLEITESENQSLQDSKKLKKLKMVKQAKLEHRIRPWAVAKLKQDLINLDLSTREGERTADNLLKMVNTQVHKKLLVNVLGVTGALLGLISISLTLLAVPGLIPLIAFTLFCVLTTARYLVTAGMLEHEGWSFSVTECIPDFIKNIASKIKCSAERGLAHLQDYSKGQKRLEIKAH